MNYSSAPKIHTWSMREMVEPNIDEKTIGILLAGRKSIDDTRSAKQTSRLSLKTATENKTGIPVGHTVESVATKEDYSVMQTAFSQLVEDRTAILAGLGFASIDEFYKFNEEMCLAALQNTIPLLRGCDRCGDLFTTAKETPCVSTDGCPDFYDHWEDTPEWERKLYEIILYIWHNSEVHEDGTFTKLLKELPVQEKGNLSKGGFSICPAGHGFEFGYTGMPKFDLNWK